MERFEWLSDELNCSVSEIYNTFLEEREAKMTKEECLKKAKIYFAQTFDLIKDDINIIEQQRKEYKKELLDQMSEKDAENWSNDAFPYEYIFKFQY